MSEELVSLISVQQEKVDKKCKELKELELIKLRSSKFSDFDVYLSSVWSTVIDEISLKGEMPPVITIVTDNPDIVEFQSAMYRIRFTKQTLPYTSKEKQIKEVLNFATLERSKGNGKREAKRLNIPFNLDPEARQATVRRGVFNDIISGLYDESETEISTVFDIFVFAIVTYYQNKNWVYQGSHLDLEISEVGDPIKVVKFTSGLETVTLYLNKEAADDDWIDFKMRYQEAFRSNKTNNKGTDDELQELSD